MIRFGVVSAALVVLAFAAPAAAQEEKKPWWEQKLLPDPFSATFNFATDYRFRGISQTNRDPAYQGSFDFDKEVWDGISLYAGVWASNVKFFRADVEVDVYGGIKGKIDKFGWNLSLVGYLYPGAPGSLRYNYFDVIPAISYDFGVAEAAFSVALTPDYFAGSGFAAFPFGELKVPIPLAVLTPYKVAFTGSLGYQFIERNSRFGTPDYLKWSAGVSASVFGLNMRLRYVDTNLSRAECGGGTNLCSGAAVFMISRTF